MSSYYFIGDTLTGPGRWTTGTFTGNVTVGGTLGVTGISTLTGGIATAVPFKSGSTTVSTVDTAGTLVPAAINPSTYYVVEEFDRTTTGYSVAGSAGTNYNIATPNAISAAFFTTSTLGGAYVATSSSSAGGFVFAGMSQNIVKSSTINYQWRFLFYVGTLSDATNPYTLIIGGPVMGAATTGSLPITGPYLSYTHGTNSGRWVMGSATNTAQTTANSSVAAATGWHSLTISLANGTYTYTLDGASLGTVADANMVTTVANNQGASLGGICIIPGGAFTTARYAAIDRCDYYVTGLSR